LTRNSLLSEAMLFYTLRPPLVLTFHLLGSGLFYFWHFWHLFTKIALDCYRFNRYDSVIIKIIITPNGSILHFRSR